MGDAADDADDRADEDGDADVAAGDADVATTGPMWLTMSKRVTRPTPMPTMPTTGIERLLAPGARDDYF